MSESTVHGKGHLIRGIGLISSSFIVLNGMIGAGIFALPPAVAERIGVLSPWFFVVAGVLIIFVVLTFAELSSYVRTSGGPALYATRAFGPVVGFSTGWIYYISRAAAIAANSHALALYLGAIWAWFDTDVGHAVVIVAFLSGLTLVNVLGVKDGVRALAVFTFFKVIPLLLMILLGLQYIDADVLFPASLPVIDDAGGTMLLLIYAYIGFESVSIPAEETQKPRRTIPSALVRTVTLTAILYFLIMLVYVLVLRDELASGATLVDVGRRLAGPVGAIAITLAAIFSIGGNLAGTMLAGPRMTLALAEQGVLPQWFGRIHERFSSPANSIVFLGALSMLLALSGTFVKLIIASSVARLLTYMVSIAALPRIRQQASAETRARAYRLKGGYTIPVIAFGICVWMASHSSADAWKFLIGLFLVGLVLFFIARAGLRKSGAEASQ